VRIVVIGDIHVQPDKLWRMLREAGHKARRQKGKVDASAAAILLQSYLDLIQS